MKRHNRKYVQANKMLHEMAIRHNISVCATIEDMSVKNYSE